MYIYWKSEQKNTKQEPRVDFWSSVRNTWTGSYLSFVRDRKCGLDALGIFFSLFKILINELNSFQGTRAHVSSEGFTSQPKASCWSQARPLKSRSAIAPRSFVFHLKMKPYLAIQEISTYTSVFSLGYRETAGRFLVGWLKGHFVPLLIFLCRWIRADGPIQQYSTSTVSADNIDWEQLPCLLCIDLMMGQAHMELAVLAFSP